MPGIVPVPWKVLEKIFIKDGFVLASKAGSHRSYKKPGLARPIVIPVHTKPVRVSVILSNMKTAGMTRERYFKLLKDCQ
jgi:predicted RNA binding protein YcfA (HicA-like mRNA interferase family)